MLYLSENECLNGYFEIMGQTVSNRGVPLSVYSDQHTIFRSPKTEEQKAAGEEVNLTQFGRALDELGIELIHARTPQAKGRIERVWVTLQSRLPVELRLKDIQTMAAANDFLQGEYLSMFNEQFAVPAEGNIFVPCKHMEELDSILCVKDRRKMDNAGSFSYKGRTFKVLDEGYPLIPAKAEVTVLISTRRAICVQYKSRVFQTVTCEKPRRTAPDKKAKTPDDIQVKAEPHLKHGSEAWKRVWHAEDYNETLDFLYEVFLKNDSQFV